MMARIRVETRGAGDLEQTVVLRDGATIGVLPAGDPLRYLLELPVDNLRTIMRTLSPALQRRPRTQAIIEAIIEYKEEKHKRA